MISAFEGEYIFLNTFFYVPIEYQGITYSCAEAAIQAQKTVLIEERQTFASLPAGLSRSRGRRLIPRSSWDKIRNQVVYEVNYIKFNENEDLKQKLLATQDEEIYYYNTWHDNWLGECTCRRCKNRRHYNILGIALTQIRIELKTNKPMSKIIYEEKF